jgi:hypothetical protein
MKEVNLYLFLGLFVILGAVLVTAYPILEEGIKRTGIEEQFFSYNLTKNVTGTISGNLNFTINAINSTNSSLTDIGDYHWISLNSSTGNLTINATKNNETGNFTITVEVTDDSGQGTIVDTYFNITPINDAPVFSNLQNYSWIQGDTGGTNLVSNFQINVSDEESNFPLNFSVNVTSCSFAEWSNRTDDDCAGLVINRTLGNTTALLNFSTSNNDVGNYTINFTVVDSLGGTISELATFSINNSNDLPYFTYSCDNARNASEDTPFTCLLNASDIDELYNINFTSNTSWFTFNLSNGSLSNTINAGFNISAENYTVVMANFTPTDLAVGNWSLNISLVDSSGAENSTVFWFFVNNTEDFVYLDPIANTSALYINGTFYINASDEDLLVLDKSVKDENLTFTANVSWISITKLSQTSGVNYSQASVDINYDYILSNLGVGNHSVKINVTDSVGNYDEQNFTVLIANDSAVVWNNTGTHTFSIDEGDNIYINLTEYVNDSEGDAINFSYTNDTLFDSFNLTILGIINFTSTNLDVGQHILVINASDGKKNSLSTFNFTILNVNDIPVLNSIVNQTTYEDNLTEISIIIIDDDFRIPSNQKGFYNESLSVTRTITNSSGGQQQVFGNFSLLSLTNGNRSTYNISFTPTYSQVGVYNVSVTVTDNSSSTSQNNFTLTINSVDDAPNLGNLTTQYSSKNRTLYYSINATDEEDGNSFTSGNLNFTFNYTMLSGADIFNFSTFNLTTGILNMTFNETHVGKYHLNVSVNDSVGSSLLDWADFWVYVYGVPNVTSPLTDQTFNLIENISSDLIFGVNHTVADNLTYEFYINNVLTNNLSYFGNGSNYTWSFKPNFTEETYGIKNLSLVVLNSVFNDLNYTQNWNITINHTNAPVNFTGTIGTQAATYDNAITLDLTNYFSDADYSDVNYNQTVNFSVAGLSAITASVSDSWVLTLSAITSATESLTITADDLNDSNSTLTSISSNNFEVAFTAPSVAAATSSSGGGSGGGSNVQYVSLKLLVPGESQFIGENIIQIPVTVQNSGLTNLAGISLSGIVSYNNALTDDVRMNLGTTYIASLAQNEARNFTVTLNVDRRRIGNYKVTIFANVTSPKFSDFADFNIQLITSNETDAGQVVVFTENYVVENPECLELRELIEESRKLLDEGREAEARVLAEQAITACENAISQRSKLEFAKNYVGDKFFYSFFITIIVFAFGLVFYFYKRIRFNKFREDYI